MKRKVFTSFGQRYQISTKILNNILDRLLKRFIKYYPILFTINMPEKKKNLLEKMIVKRIRDLE